ncbi:MAG: aminoacyl-histidine dipeptidase [Candidatus Thermoplasmatota archaeon]
MSILENIEPKLVWKHFEAISAIPRCSKHEEKIREYIIQFAKKQKLSYKTDKTGNIVVSKPAAPGVKNKRTLIVQGHMDMVCEKNSDVIHDFTKDPLKLKRNGDILTASGTTLGADNGIGISVALALLEDTTVKNGPLEALFTVDEETGLTGAFAMESDFLTGKTMLNLDSEEFGILTVGCAGGGDTKIELPITTKTPPKNTCNLIMKISGLRGGHSGVNIHEQRGNAIKILARLLWKAARHHEFFISDLKGGDKHNAIPREAYATIAIARAEKTAFTTFLTNEAAVILDEIKPIDPDVNLSIQETDPPERIIDKTCQICLLNLLQGLPHGVHKMSYDIPTLVQTSTNLAVVQTKEKTVFIHMSSRSAVKSELQDMRDRIAACAQLAGATITEDTPYPGWKPNMNSPILALSKKVYKELFHAEPKVEAVHAGLECGIIGEKFPGMDMISMGPSIKYLHSPQEQVSISSVEKFYTYVVKIIENF